jgi:hypothetical protein
VDSVHDLATLGGLGRHDVDDWGVDFRLRQRRRGLAQQLGYADEVSNWDMRTIKTG